MESLTKHKPEALSQAASLLGHIGGKIGGRSKSLAKRRASKRNGRLGGRPQKLLSELTPAGRYARKRRESRKAESSRG